MKKTINAALLSALVFPGAGHLYLKRWVTGALLVGVSLIALYGLVTRIMDVANQIVDQVLRGEIPLDVASLSAAVSQRVAGTDTQALNIATWVIIACWVVGIVDSIRVGRRQERK